MQRVQMWTVLMAPSTMIFVFWTFGLKTRGFLGARRAHPILCLWRMYRPNCFDFPQYSH